MWKPSLTNGARMVSNPSRQRAMKGVQAIFDRYHLIKKETDYNGFDTSVMTDLILLDASISPSYSPSYSPSSNTTTTTTTTTPSPPETPNGNPPPTPTNTFPPGPEVLASTTFSLLITPPYSNQNAVLHGGAAAAILDMATTCALGPMARRNFWEYLAGVTRTFNINYIKPVPVGTKVHVHAHLYGLGRTMAYIKAFITSEDGRTVYTTCDVNKVGLPAKEEHMRHRVAWDEQWEGDVEGEKSKL